MFIKIKLDENTYIEIDLIKCSSVAKTIKPFSLHSYKITNQIAALNFQPKRIPNTQRNRIFYHRYARMSDKLLIIITNNKML